VLEQSEVSRISHKASPTRSVEDFSDPRSLRHTDFPFHATSRVLSEDGSSSADSTSCSDVPEAFSSISVCVGGSDCFRVLSAAAPLFDGISGVCGSTVAQFAALSLQNGCPAPFSPPIAQTEKVVELCRGTCSEAGVFIPGCMPSPVPPTFPFPPHLPPLPPSPPIVPGLPGYATVTSLQELRAAVGASLPGDFMALFLPSNVVFVLRGSPIVVHGITLEITSDGAIIDAQYRSMAFDLKSAILRLHGITIVNCYSSSLGGVANIRQPEAALLAVGVQIINSASAISGGVFFLTAGNLTLIRSLISNSTADGYGGVLMQGGGLATFSATSIINSIASTRDGGVAYTTAGVLDIRNNCSFVNSSSGRSGGVVFLFDGLAMIASSRMEKSTASEAGAICVSGGSLILTDSTLCFSRAARQGGALNLLAVHVVIIRSTIMSSEAELGAAIYSAGATLVVSGQSLIATSDASQRGGAFHITEGSVLLDEGTIIMNSTASESGGAILLDSGRVTLANGSSIMHSRVKWLFGGAIRSNGGSVTVSTNCYIVDSFAPFGGMVYISSGAVTIIGSRVRDSTASGDGGFCFLEGGELHLVNSSVERSSCSSSGGMIIHIPSDTTGVGPLLLLTFVELRQHLCDSPLFSQLGAAQILLRQVRVTALPGCNSTNLASSSAFHGVVTKGCGESYSDRQQQVVGTCASTESTSCSSHRVPGTVIQSLTCRCAWPEFENPENPLELAPYLPSGCLSLRMFKQLIVQSEELSITLSKPNHMFDQVNATLIIQGNDWGRPATWEVSNANAVRERSPWLRLLTEGGHVAGRVQLPIEMSLSATGLRERAATYTETLQITVRSSMIAHTQPLNVFLVVQARTDFAVWGRVSPDAQCSRSDTTASNRSFFVGQLERLVFTACDTDGNPVDHQLPSQSDERRFSALLNGTNADPQSTRIEYTRAGSYEILFTLDKYGPFVHVLYLGEVEVARQVGVASCPRDRVPLPSGRCGCKSGTFQLTEHEQCNPCKPASTSSPNGAVGEGSCSVCNHGYYRLSADSSPSSCIPCLAGAACDFNTTLQTLILREGFWRLSPWATRLLTCTNATSACLGGDHVGKCADGRSGPRCSVCTEPDTYHDAATGRCLACPDAGGRTLIALGLLLSVFVLFATLKMVYEHPLGRMRGASILLHEIVDVGHRLGLSCKLRIFIAFFQSVTVIGNVYQVTLPHEYIDWIQYFDWLFFDWVNAMIPAACIGHFERRMLLMALTPLGLFASIAAYQIIRSHANGRPLVEAVLSSTGPCLLLIFLVTPSTNRSIFKTWDCVPFEFSAANDRLFLRDDLAVECDGEEYNRITNVACILMVVWPVGSVALFALLALRARQRLLNHTPDQFVRSIKLLHGDFKPEYYYWASVELFQRSILTGWVLLIHADQNFIRLVVAFLTTLAMLEWTVISRPYCREENNALAVASTLLLLLTYSSSILIKVLHDVQDIATTLGDPGLASRVLGFASTTGIVAMLICFQSVVLISLILAGISGLRSEERMQLLRLKETGMLPKLTTQPGVKWMLFISHVWSTGQDQAATIKRQLQRMLLTISIFLDVDDLQEIGDLEKYIEQSACILLFLSHGYLSSRNCLREIRASVQKNKARTLVWEADTAKGGAPLSEIRDKACPLELRNDIFSNGAEPIRWHRVAEHQLVSLKLIAERLLLASPEYSERRNLELTVHGELLTSELELPDGVCLLASMANPGALDLAEELRSRFRELSITTVIPHNMAEHITSGNRKSSRRISGRSSFMSHLSAACSPSAVTAGANALPRFSLRLSTKPSSNDPNRVSASNQGGSNNADPTHFLLLLESDVFLRSTSHELAAQLRAARACNLPIVMAHIDAVEEGGSLFSW